MHVVPQKLQTVKMSTEVFRGISAKFYTKLKISRYTVLQIFCYHTFCNSLVPRLSLRPDEK